MCPVYVFNVTFFDGGGSFAIFLLTLTFGIQQKKVIFFYMTFFREAPV
jgi:hypothetical protein